MAENSIRKQTPLNIVGNVRVDLLKDEIDQLVWDKGIPVYWDQTVMCPCRSQNTSPLLTCQNCLGTGWVMINRLETKMVMSSINMTTKYSVWSPERVGTIQLTILSQNKISFMDRISVLGGEMIESEIVYLSELGDVDERKIGFTSYRIKEMIEVFAYKSDSDPLRKLVPDEDYTIEDYKIFINKTNDNANLSLVSMRYKANPEYYIVDIPHDIRNSERVDNRNRTERIDLPVSAIGKRSHMVLERLRVGATYNDNSYL